MKSNILYLAVPILVMYFTSCSKIAEHLERDVQVTDTVYFEIPTITDISKPVTIAGIASSINLEQQIQAQVQDLSVANLSSAKLRRMDLDLAFVGKDSLGRDSIDTENNFGNLQSIKFELTQGAKTDSLSSVIVTSAAKTSNLSLTLRISPETLKSYLPGSGMQYSVILRAKKATTKKMFVRAAAWYTVTLSK
jgi:hypothetical protein